MDLSRLASTNLKLKNAGDGFYRLSSHDKFDMARTYEKLIKIESEMDKVH